jgi:murein DD-endopeptidase MepM/ murein hydrolase activator NlpD
MWTALFEKMPPVKVIDESIDYKDYINLDLSAGNTDLELVNTDDAAAFGRYLNKYLSQHRAKVAYGGYNEKRNLYKRSTIFKDDNSPERDIHIGLDLWSPAGTVVLAALAGKVHSFNYNTGIGNYGPTLLLEHTIEEQVFYTLYGHLSLESIAELEIGQTVKASEQIGTLGDATVNGDYAPHLHFQLIRDISGYFGDYPGVCSEQQLPFYLENCPDPNLLLKIYKR